MVHSDLPSFTKGTSISFLQQGSDGSKVKKVSDGAILKRIDLCSNKTVGPGNQSAYIRALSTQNYRNSRPNLFTNGASCDWRSEKGHVNLIYPKVYDKAYELSIHALPKFERKYGKNSSEVKYIKNLIDYCNDLGVVRFEQGLKSRFLSKNNLSFYGLFEESNFDDIQNDFLSIDSRLQVENMNLQNISEQLISSGICLNSKSANTTSMYAMQWMMGHKFDFTKTQPQTHRARLRKIGIDIANPCDLSRFSPVKPISSKTIHVGDLLKPEWYQDKPQLRAVS